MSFRYIFVFFIFFACNNKEDSNKETATQNGQPAKPDQEMAAASQKARDEYATFLQSLKDSSDKIENGHAVKLSFRYDENNSEHIWLNDLFFAGSKLFGVLTTPPVHIDRVNFGDTLLITKDSVSDWMYLRNNKLVGGYTIRLLYERMSQREKDEFRDEVSFEID